MTAAIPWVYRQHATFDTDQYVVYIRPNVDVPLQTVQQVTVGLATGDTEQRRVVQLEALSQGEAERHVALRVVKRERDVLQAIERFGSEARVRQHRPVFLPAVGEIDLGSNCLVVPRHRRAHDRRCGE